MFQDEAATLKPGDWLEYELHREFQANGTIITTSVMADFVKPSTSHRRVVIRPQYKIPTWNRARSVGIDRLHLIARAWEAS